MASPFPPSSASYARPQNYAPTPYSYTPTSSLNVTISLDQEVSLPSNPSERDTLESLAELYSIIVTLDDLEKAFTRGSVTESEYTTLCGTMIRQYREILKQDRVAREFGSLEGFQREWNVDCPRATARLQVGVPATVASAAPETTSSRPTHGAADSDTVFPPSGGRQGPSSVQDMIAATENFITFLDALRLGINSKDPLHPLLSDVITSVTKITQGEFEGRGSIIKWLIKLNQMRATDELNDDEKREVEFEMEAAYRGFKTAVTG